MASDSAASYAAGPNFTIGQQHVQKVRKLGNSILYASTGSIGMSQLISDVVERQFNAQIDKKNLSSTQSMSHLGKCIYEETKHLSQSAALLAQAGMRHVQMEVGCRSLVALPIGNRPCMIQFGETGAPEEATHELCCVALGSGQPIADPFLAFMKRILWSDHAPSLAEARLVAAWTIRHVVQTNPGGVGGELQMWTLSVKGNQTKIEELDAGEHYERIKVEEASLRGHILKPEPPATTPTEPAKP